MRSQKTFSGTQLDSYFVFLGPLHSEMLCGNMLGDWMQDSGWVEMLIDADVTSPGRAEALVKGSHVTWTRYAHQVTALSLSILERMPIHDTRLSVRIMGLNSYRSKPGEYRKVVRQTVYDMDMLLLRFVRSIRTGDLFLYEKSWDQTTSNRIKS